MFSSSQCVLRQAATSLRHELRHQRFHRLVCVKAAAQHSSSQALEPASSTDDTTSSTSVSNGTTSAVPPLSDITLTELKSDISTAMWNEQKWSWQTSLECATCHWAIQTTRVRVWRGKPPLQQRWSRPWYVLCVATSVSGKAVFCRARTEPYPGYYPYPELLYL